MKTKATYFAVFLILCPLLFVTCQKYINVSYGDNGTTAVVKNITIGTLKEVASGTIATSGGTITVSGSGTKIDGLKITVPDSAFGSAQTITVSVADISGHQLGEYFNPISPLINIDCPGGYANELMSVTIPVTIPAGSIAVGFFLDAETGKLEGIPVAEATNNSITLISRHFLSGTMARGNATGLKNGKVETPKGANIIISSFTESLLSGKSMISSGYKPGTDDWEFVNRGSYIAPGGHCAGQNMAAMWYWFERKPIEGSLFNKFSDNPNLWQDNARGYRFCSVIHEDLGGSGVLIDIFDRFIDKNQVLDKLKLYTIAAAMLVNGEPQGVGIYFQNGNYADGKPKYGGHDLICYQVSVMEGKLYISDPNTPGTGQIIEFRNNQFAPYTSKLNGEESDMSFPFVTYYAKTAYIEWNKIGKRYEELLDGSIGTVGDNQFPGYTITATNDGNKELKDGYVTGKDTLHFTVFCPTTEMYYDVDGKKVTGMMICNEQGGRIETQDGIDANDVDLNSSSYITLKLGLNKIGCLIYGWRRNLKFDNGIYKNKFIDFKWYTVNYIPLEITPNPLIGVMLVDYTFTARTQGYAPANAKYTWDFGDGSTEVTVLNDSTVVHKFPEDADYEIMVTLYDNSTNKKVSEAYSSAEIKNGDRVHEFNFTRISPGEEISLGSNWSPLMHLKVTLGLKAQGLAGNMVVGCDTVSERFGVFVAKVLSSEPSGNVSVSWDLKASIIPTQYTATKTTSSGFEYIAQVLTYDLNSISNYYWLPDDNFLIEPMREGASGTYEGEEAERLFLGYISCIMYCNYKVDSYNEFGALTGTTTGSSSWEYVEIAFETKK